MTIDKHYRAAAPLKEHTKENIFLSCKIKEENVLLFIQFFRRDK